MTTKKLKRLTFILTILLVAITFLIIYKHYQRYNEEFNATKTYEEASKGHKKTGKLNTVVDENNPDIVEVNRYLEQIKFNGTAAVFENGQLKLNKGYGMKNFKEDKKNRADTLYLIGSSQKFTTGLMLKQLVNEKKINMNEPVTKYLPWFKTTQTITLNQLMQHKSGLYKYKASLNIKI
ncbi:serine hydrolase domain-containing protein [Staphylococcus sp. KG4-1]|nr:serine hydrolase domain-containing protein [Staphylococcus sp. KG4-1]